MKNSRFIRKIQTFIYQAEFWYFQNFGKNALQKEIYLYDIDDYNNYKLMEEIDTQIEKNLIGNFERVNEQLQNNPNNQDEQEKQVDEVQLMNQDKELKDLMDN